MFLIGILKSAWLLKADVEEKEDRIFKGRGSEQELSTSIRWEFIAEYLYRGYVDVG